MNAQWTRAVRWLLVAIFATAATFLFRGETNTTPIILAQATPTPAAAAFDQAAALAKLREQIKGKEKESASAVFQNIQMMKSVPAGRLLAVMEMGYARSLGVNCTHCHVPDKWESEEKAPKQIAREMSSMVTRLNGELLAGIKNLKSETPTINCTTCHRGEIKPALNLTVR
jgi:hypothetical protein